MKTRNAQASAAVAGMLTVASVASANPGTGMLWVVASQLFLGNLVIGIIEGVGASVVFRVNVVLAMVVLVVTNYISGWVGMIALMPTYRLIMYSTMEYPIDAALWSLVATIVASFILCMVLEFPSFWMLARWKGMSLRKAAIACVVINLPTNAVVWGYFMANANTTLATATHRAAPERVLADTPAFDLYVIARGRERVERIAWDGVALSRTPAPASQDNVFGEYDHLLPERLDTTDAGRADPITHLVVYVSESLPRYPIVDTSGFGPVFRIAPWDRYPELRDPITEYDVIVGYRLADYRSERDRTWYPTEPGDNSMQIRDGAGAVIATLGWMIPTDVWIFDRALALPGDVLVVSVADQILAIHIPTMRMAPLAHGTDPVVVLRENPDALK